ncbi:MAG: hypothetical protein II710_01420, partial [Clostridia bacterium]|nr:hypothetical protein [Clostridia bacterium]
HRIDEVVEGGYKTKGDNVLSVRDSWTVHPEDILSVYVCNMPILTFIGRLLMSPMGLAVIILAFVLLCAIVYVPEIVKTLKEPDEEKKSTLDEEEMKRRIAEEVEKLKQQQKQQEQQKQENAPDPGPAEEPAEPKDQSDEPDSADRTSE